MNQLNSIQQNRNGFTLVEILVVITLVILLAALSFTLVPKLRKRADAAKQVSIVQQIGPLMIWHTAEKNGLLPPIVTTQENGSLRSGCSGVW